MVEVNITEITFLARAIMGLKQKAINGAKWTTISNLLTIVLQFIQLGVLARILGPTAFGLVGMVTVITGLTKIYADMGISKAIIQKQDVTLNQLSSLYWLNVLSGFIVSGVLVLITPLVVMFYQEPQLKNLMYCAAIIFVITSFGQQFQMLLQKELKFKILAKVDVLSNIIGIITTVILALLGVGVISLILGQLVTASIKMIMLVIIGFKTWRPKLHFNKSDLKGFISFGLYQMGDNTINYINSNIDFILIGRFLGSEALGYYTLAYNIIIMPISKINPVITKVSFPVFSKIQGDNLKLKKGFMQVMQVLTFINFPILFGLASTAMMLVPLFFGDDWDQTIFLIQILFGVGILRSIGNPAGSLVIAKGRADLGFKWNALLMITQIPGIYIGLKFGGLIGVATSFLFLEVIYCILNYLIIIRKLLDPCLKDYFHSIWPAFWISLLMGIVVFINSQIFTTNNDLFTLIIQICLGICLYLILSIKFNNKIINEIKSALHFKS